jgi:hypothetical protein
MAARRLIDEHGEAGVFKTSQEKIPVFPPRPPRLDSRLPE